MHLKQQKGLNVHIVAKELIGFVELIGREENTVRNGEGAGVFSRTVLCTT